MNYMEQAFENALQEQITQLPKEPLGIVTGFKKGAHWAKMYYQLLDVAKQLHEKHPEMQAAKRDAYQKELEARFGTIAKPTVLSYSAHGQRVVVDIDHSGTTSDEVADLFMSLLGACGFGPTNLHESLYYKLKDYLEAFDSDFKPDNS